MAVKNSKTTGVGRTLGVPTGLKPPALRAMMSRIGERLTALRKEARWSFEKLAEESDLKRSTVARASHGQSLPNRTTLEKLAAALTRGVGHTITIPDLEGADRGSVQDHPVLLARRAKQITQHQLATLVGVPRAALAGIERDGWIPPAAVRRRLAEVLGVDEADLFTDRFVIGF